MDAYFDLNQTASIDILVSVQAENNKNVWKLLFSSTLSLCVSLLMLAYFFKQLLHTHYAPPGRDLFVICAMY